MANETANAEPDVDTRFMEGGSGLELTPAIPPDTPPPKPDMGPLLEGSGYSGKPILSTSFNIVPSKDNKGAAVWNPPAPTATEASDPYLTTGTGPQYDLSNPPDTGAGRTLRAVGQAWNDTDIMSPEARTEAAKNPVGWFGKWIANPAGTIASVPAKLAAAAGSGIVQAAYELGSGISPELGRALATLAIVAPTAETPVGAPRLLPSDMGLPYGFRDITGPLPPDPFPKPSPDMTAKITGKLPPGSERIPPEMPTSLPDNLSAGDIKTVVDARYGNVDRSSDVTSANAVDRAVDLAVPSGLDDATRRALGKDSVIAKWIDNIQGMKGKDLPVQAWKGADQSLTDDINADSTTPAQRTQLEAIQRNLRGSIENPSTGDLIAGDGTGYDNLQAARQANSQYAKMQALEDITRKSGLRINEPQSVRSQIATFLSDPANTRGWSTDEIAAATNAQSISGLIDVIHSMGSKVGPAAAMGASIYHGFQSGDPLGGFLAAPVYAAGAYAGGSIPRAIENMVVRRRMQNALNILGQNVPVDPLNENLLPPQPRPQIVPDTRALTYPTLGAGAPRQQ